MSCVCGRHRTAAGCAGALHLRLARREQRQRPMGARAAGRMPSLTVRTSWRATFTWSARRPFWRPGGTRDASAVAAVSGAARRTATERPLMARKSTSGQAARRVVLD
jgi:hypothetical protein